MIFVHFAVSVCENHLQMYLSIFYCSGISAFVAVIVTAAAAAPFYICSYFTIRCCKYIVRFLFGTTFISRNVI